MRRKQYFKTLLLLLCVIVSLLSTVIFSDGCLRQARERRVFDTALLAAEQYHVSPALILAVIRTESDFYADAVSRAGAVGLMQIMPQTYDYLCTLDFKSKGSDLFDPELNLSCGAYYLCYLFARFQSLETVLAAYNAGEGRVSEWLKDPTLAENGRLVKIPFPETEQYVKKTLRAYQSYQRKYNFNQ